MENIIRYCSLLDHDVNLIAASAIDGQKRETLGFKCFLKRGVVLKAGNMLRIPKADFPVNIGATLPMLQSGGVNVFAPRAFAQLTAFDISMLESSDWLIVSAPVADYFAGAFYINQPYQMVNTIPTVDRITLDKIVAVGQKVFRQDSSDPRPVGVNGLRAVFPSIDLGTYGYALAAGRQVNAIRLMQACQQYVSWGDEIRRQQQAYDGGFLERSLTLVNGYLAARGFRIAYPELQ